MAKNKAKIIEKRKAMRIKPLLEVNYKFDRQTTWCKKAIISDISGTGMKIYIFEPLEKGKDIMILAKDSQGLSAIEALCAIQWCRKLKKNNFEAGLQFKKIKNKELFFDLITGKMLSL